MKSMRTWTKILALLVPGIALLYPLLEVVDFWDLPGNIQRTGSDTELDLLLVVLFFGLLVALARLILVLVGTTIWGSLPITAPRACLDGRQPTVAVVLVPGLVPLRI